MNSIKKDIIVFGGGISGLSSALVLRNLGFEVLLLEKSESLGGINQSLQYGEHIFDCGYHAIDYGRSPVTARFIKKVLKDKIFIHELKRMICLGDYLMPYNSSIDEWPTELQDMIKLSNELNSQDSSTYLNSLKKMYGEKFTNYIVEEALNSYPTLRWGVSHGRPLEDCLSLVYPWFFPRNDLLKYEAENESENYHFRMRREKQKVLYPGEGGFDTIITALADEFTSNGGEIISGIPDMKLNINNNNLIDIQSGENSYASDIYLWCAPLPALLYSLGVKLPKLHPQFLVLGSFVLDEEAKIDTHEILVGSRNHMINRISFPSALQNNGNYLIQVEYLYPEGECELSEDEWIKSWSESLEAMGIINKDTVKEAHFLKQRRGFAYSIDSNKLKKQLQKKFESIETNVKVPYPAYGPVNINRVITGSIIGAINYANEGIHY